MCSSPVISMKSRKRRKIFYVCDKSLDPNCAFISWNLPLAEKCELCGAYKEERIYRRQKSVICSNENCPSRAKKNKKAQSEVNETSETDATENKKTTAREKKPKTKTKTKSKTAKSEKDEKEKSEADE